MDTYKTVPIFVVFGLLSACATPHQTTATLEKDAAASNNINIIINTKQPTKNANGEDLICEETKKTGTRLHTQTSCHTKVEWDYIKSQSQENIKNMYLKHGSDHG